MIDANKETLLRLNKAGQLPALSATGRPALPGAMWRYHKFGRQSVMGRTVKLETIRLPGGNFTSVEAVDRFIAALNDGPDSTAAAAPNTGGNTAAVDKAEAELANAGIR